MNPSLKSIRSECRVARARQGANAARVRIAKSSVNVTPETLLVLKHVLPWEKPKNSMDFCTKAVLQACRVAVKQHGISLPEDVSRILSTAT